MNQDDKEFRGWRLLGIIIVVMVSLALVAALVDWMVLGSLEGRVY